MPRILIISQVYVPDPAAVGQYMADGAQELAARGYDVRVLTSGRGYADPSVKYPPREMLAGVDVVRLPLSSLGKKTLVHRLVAQTSFLLQVIFRGWFTRDLAAVVVSTSPPMASLAALAIRLFRRAPITFWVMDLNPDQVVATGRMKQSSLPVRAFDWINRRILAASAAVIPLDRFMADRLNAKRDVTAKTTIIPPWPMEQNLEEVPRDENPFLDQHNLRGKRVIMYSGNHGLTTPVDTLVEAALELRDDPRLAFVFIGAGAGKEVVDRAIADHAPPNLLSLPYLPLSEIKYSLSAADVHVVLMNEELVGIVHPCKVYGALKVARPLLYFGPRPSHITELLDATECGWEARQGDTSGTVEILKRIAELPDDELSQLGLNGRQLLESTYSRGQLCGTFCDVVTQDIALKPS